MDITRDNVCSSMLSCFYSHLLSTGRPISSFDCSRVGQHALVLGSGGSVRPDPAVPVQPTLSAHSIIQSGSAQDSGKP